MKLPHKRVALVLGLTMAGVAIAVVAHASSQTGLISSFNGADAIVYKCTASTSYTNMPTMAVTFNQGGAESSVVVMFQGAVTFDSAGGPFDTGYIRLRIDGIQQDPGEIPAIGADDRGTHGFNWESTSLPPGVHTARVQWRTDLGSNFCVDARSLIVLHS